MSSGRSARLPPTPAVATAAAAAAAVNSTTATANKPRAIHNTLPEPNSNNVLPHSAYSHIKNNSNNSNNGISMVGVSGGNIGSVGGMPMMMSGGGVGGYTNFCVGMNTHSGGVIGGTTLGGVASVGGGGSISTIDAATEGIPSETIDALGPELAVATSQVLENLSEAERKMIIEVLNRDENVRQRDATRIM
ncbi:unnamed protein product [Ceratitis capitata]|uniref:(Mediterranean fruit fly) hypothetical protein n=3 Tax=Ceratitis capitata TaxID=7213 RepID=A0A811U6F3_CERCA|nr:unnamed protein product [Ceratitis capitata]